MDVHESKPELAFYLVWVVGVEVSPDDKESGRELVILYDVYLGVESVVLEGESDFVFLLALEPLIHQNDLACIVIDEESAGVDAYGVVDTALAYL